MDVLGNRAWYRMSGQSFYGYFGYLTVALPVWQYYVAGIAAICGVVATFSSAVVFPSTRSRALQLLFLCAVLSVLLSIGVSLYHSWTFDFQPQGRYFFGSVPAAALLVGGMTANEPTWLQSVRVAVWMLLVLISLGSLLLIVPAHPGLMA